MIVIPSKSNKHLFLFFPAFTILSCMCILCTCNNLMYNYILKVLLIIK